MYFAFRTPYDRCLEVWVLEATVIVESDGDDDGDAADDDCDGEVNDGEDDDGDGDDDDGEDGDDKDSSDKDGDEENDDDENSDADDIGDDADADGDAGINGDANDDDLASTTFTKDEGVGEPTATASEELRLIKVSLSVFADPSDSRVSPPPMIPDDEFMEFSFPTVIEERANLVSKDGKLAVTNGASSVAEFSGLGSADPPRVMDVLSIRISGGVAVDAAPPRVKRGRPAPECKDGRTVVSESATTFAEVPQLVRAAKTYLFLSMVCSSSRQNKAACSWIKGPIYLLWLTLHYLILYCLWRCAGSSSLLLESNGMRRCRHILSTKPFTRHSKTELQS